jgi:hypothetical protein
MPSAAALVSVLVVAAACIYAMLAQPSSAGQLKSVDAKAALKSLGSARRAMKGESSNDRLFAADNIIKAFEQDSGKYREKIEDVLLKCAGQMAERSEFLESMNLLYRSITVVPSLHSPREYFSHQFPLTMRGGGRVRNLPPDVREKSLQRLLEMANSKDLEWSRVSKLNYGQMLSAQVMLVNGKTTAPDDPKIQAVLEDVTTTVRTNYAEAIASMKLRLPLDVTKEAPHEGKHLPSKVHIVSVATDDKEELGHLRESIKRANSTATGMWEYSRYLGVQQVCACTYTLRSTIHPYMHALIHSFLHTPCTPLPCYSQRWTVVLCSAGAGNELEWHWHEERADRG